MEGTNFQVLELPYAYGQVVMDILLPTQVDGWSQLEQQLSPAFLSNVLAAMSLTEVEIHLPRFTFESSYNLVAPLEAMGMVDAFDPGGADFSGIDGASDLYISEAYHKAWVQVNESGTVAAAGTAVIGGAAVAPPPPPVFRADHPFLFFIRDVGTGSLLFVGRVVFPSQAAGDLAPTPMLSMAPSANGLKISWPVVLTGWTLRQNGNLNTTNWTACTGVSTDGTNNFVTITATNGSMFYQLGQ
jgi:serpin B